MIARWIATRRAATGAEIHPIDLSACRDWSLADGRIRHRLGAFFSVIAVEYDDGQRPARSFPLIDQPEIGILGFCVTRQEGRIHWSAGKGRTGGSRGCAGRADGAGHQIELHESSWRESHAVSGAFSVSRRDKPAWPCA